MTELDAVGRLGKGEEMSALRHTPKYGYPAGGRLCRSRTTALQDRPFPFSRVVATLRHVTLLADLRLRFGSTRLPARVYLPAPSAVPAAGAPLVLWLTGRGARDVLCQDLSAAAAAVVIELGCGDGGCSDGYEIEALGWAAEHAPELGASAEPVTVAGQLAGAARAARLAIDAHESGWPVVRTQVLVRPAFSDLCPPPSAVAGAAPATIVTSGARRDDGRRYAARLRNAGVEVRELVSDARRAFPLHDLARALQ